MFAFVNILRALATMLITNSHYSPIYEIDSFAKGGAFGNSLFFIITGFCLFHIRDSFKNWYIKRLERLYIPIFLVSWFHLYAGASFLETAFFSFIFPANYWFICCLVILYPIYYYIVMHPLKNRKLVWFSILAVLYTIIYLLMDTSHYVVETAGFYGIRFSYFVNLLLMLLGGYLRKHYTTFQEKLKNRKLIVALTSLCSFIFYFIFMIAMKRYPILYRFQFVETIACLTATYSLTLLAVSLESIFRDNQDSIVLRSLQYLGGCTLEIYLVQFPIINYVGSLRISAWMKFVIATSAILLTGIILKKISQFAIKKMHPTKRAART